MIASTNPKPPKADFEKLLTLTTSRLNKLAASHSIDATTLKGRDLEPFIADEMRKDAKGTAFDGTIQVIGGQKFPDIVAAKYYGVEVKSTTQDHWTTTGNSVLESTRVDDVERIWMMFGKLADPLEFKCRPYEDCLSEVVVTHSPRYLIDMDLPAGQTIFDKIGMSYDKLRTHNPPIEPVLDYYRKQLKPGEQLWYLGSTSLVMKFWSSLSDAERDRIIVNGFVFFTEMFGNKPDKYNAITAWLVQKKSIVCPNMRDPFSAGGTEDVKANKNTYKGVPRILYNALIRLKEIKNLIDSVPTNILSRNWGVTVARKNALDKWISVVDRETKKGKCMLNITQLFNDYRTQHGI
jgi:hypothetical protein